MYPLRPCEKVELHRRRPLIPHRPQWEDSAWQLFWFVANDPNRSNTDKQVEAFINTRFPADRRSSLRELLLVSVCFASETDMGAALVATSAHPYGPDAFFKLPIRWLRWAWGATRGQLGEARGAGTLRRSRLQRAQATTVIMLPPPCILYCCKDTIRSVESRGCEGMRTRRTVKAATVRRPI